MEKMWAGRTSGTTDSIADDFNSSIRFDCRMYRQDITGSMAHAAMLSHCGILTEQEAQTLVLGLAGIMADLDEGKLAFDPAAEDIHMFVEQVLTERLGDVGKKLHTARSRNDQVALDLRLYLRQEIAAIRARVSPQLELEAFCHGAMCVSYSGRCLLSNYMTGRDSSRGACAQPCRYQYALMEEKRPGEYFPLFEDGQGTYILNSRDMCMIDHLDDLMDVGLSSLKIEGRAKSAYYAAIVTGAYRHCLDAAAAGEPIDPIWRDEVEHVSHRPYATGFYYGPPGQYYANSRYIREWQVVALVTECDEEGNATLSLRNKFRTGDTVELVGPNLRPFSMTVPEMTDQEGQLLNEPRTPQMIFHMKLPKAVPPFTLVRHAVELSAK